MSQDSSENPLTAAPLSSSSQAPQADRAPSMRSHWNNTLELLSSDTPFLGYVKEFKRQCATSYSRLLQDDAAVLAAPNGNHIYPFGTDALIKDLQEFVSRGYLTSYSLQKGQPSPLSSLCTAIEKAISLTPQLKEILPPDCFSASATHPLSLIQFREALMSDNFKQALLVDPKVQQIEELSARINSLRLSAATLDISSPEILESTQLQCRLMGELHSLQAQITASSREQETHTQETFTPEISVLFKQVEDGLTSLLNNIKTFNSDQCASFSRNFVNLNLASEMLEVFSLFPGAILINSSVSSLVTSPSGTTDPADTKLAFIPASFGRGQTRAPPPTGDNGFTFASPLGYSASPSSSSVTPRNYRAVLTGDEAYNDEPSIENSIPAASSSAGVDSKKPPEGSAGDTPLSQGKTSHNATCSPAKPKPSYEFDVAIQFAKLFKATKQSPKDANFVKDFPDLQIGSRSVSQAQCHLHLCFVGYNSREIIGFKTNDSSRVCLGHLFLEHQSLHQATTKIVNSILSDVNPKPLMNFSIVDAVISTKGRAVNFYVVVTLPQTILHLVTFYRWKTPLFLSEQDLVNINTGKDSVSPEPAPSLTHPNKDKLVTIHFKDYRSAILGSTTNNNHTLRTSALHFWEIWTSATSEPPDSSQRMINPDLERVLRRGCFLNQLDRLSQSQTYSVFVEAPRAEPVLFAKPVTLDQALDRLTDSSSLPTTLSCYLPIESNQDDSGSCAAQLWTSTFDASLNSNKLVQTQQRTDASLFPHFRMSECKEETRMSKCTFFAMGCSLPERPRFADYILLKWRILIVSTIPGRFGKVTNKPSDATEYPFRLGCLQFASRVLPEQLKVQISKLQDQQKGTQTQQKCWECPQTYRDTSIVLIRVAAIRVPGLRYESRYETG